MTRPIYCTTATAGELPRALALAARLRGLDGAADVRILLAEHPMAVGRARAQHAGVTLVGPDEIGCVDWLHMAFFYARADFGTALLPWFVAAVARDGDLVHLAPDLEVRAPLAAITDGLADSDFVFVANPASDDWQRGPFDLRLLAVRSRAADAPLLRAFQRWTADPDPWHVALAPVVFAAQVAGLCSRFAVLQPPVAGPSAAPNAAADASAPDDSFTVFTDGTPVRPEHRRAFLRLPRVNRRRIANPFAQRETIQRLADRSPEQTERMIRQGYHFVESKVLAVPLRAYHGANSLVRALSPSTHAFVYNLVMQARSSYRRLSRSPR